MRVITSWGPDGWKLYAKDFLESYVEYWPYNLTVYYEEKPDFEHPKVSWVNLYDVPGMTAYLDKIKDFPACHGVLGDTRVYQFDLFRFCRKVFAQHHAALHGSGKLFWLDADVVTFKSVPDTLLPSFLEGVYMCYQGRKDWHSCASFIGWDVDNPINKTFMDTYLNVYTRGDVFRFPQWDDSFILDKVRETIGPLVRDLTGHIETEGPANIFDLGPMGEYAHHKKGRLKLAEPQGQAFGQAS